MAEFKLSASLAGHEDDVSCPSTSSKLGLYHCL